VSAVIDNCCPLFDLIKFLVFSAHWQSNSSGTTTVLGHFPFKWSIHALNRIKFNLRSMFNINFMQLPTHLNKKDNTTI
jgi:hypothetical protein